MRLGRAKRVVGVVWLALLEASLFAQAGGQMTVRVKEDGTTVLTRSNTLIELNFGVGFDVSVSGNQASITQAAGEGGIASPGTNGIVQCGGTACDNTTTITNSSTVGQVLRVTGAATYAWGAVNLADTDAVTGVLPAVNWTLLTTEGDIFYRNGTVTTRLARGTDGQCLLSTATTIAWSTCPGGAGGITSLEGQTGATQTFTDDTNVTIVSGSDAHVITWSGTLAASRGGLGMSTVTDDTIAIANGTAWQSKAIPDCDDTGGNHLNYDTATNALSCGTSGGAGGGAPVDAQYLTLATNGTLTVERVLTAGTALDFTDGGAGSTLTVDWDSTEVGTTTFGAGSSIVWTFNASGGTDCTVTFGDGLVQSSCPIEITGTPGPLVLTEIAAPGAAGSAGQHNLYLDSTTSLLSSHENGGSLVTYFSTANLPTDLASGAIDWGGRTSFEIPNGASPTTDAFGEVAGDNNAWGSGRGAIQLFDGTANVWLVGILASDTCANGEVAKFNTGGTWTCEADATGGTSAWDTLTAPTGAVSLVSSSTGETFTIDFQSNFSASQMIVKSSTGNPTAGYILEVLGHDADVKPIKITINGTDGVEMNAGGLLSKIGAGGILADLANALSVNPADCGGTSGLNFANAIGANGDLTCVDVRAASTTQTGIAEAAIASEVDTGTDADRYVSPDALAGSTLYGTHVVEVEIFSVGTAATTGDGKAFFRVPASLNGMNLITVKANVYTAGTTGTINLDLARCAAAATGNVCSGTVSDMLSTNLTIDSGENSSSDAAAAAVIDTGSDDVATGQLIRFDIDAIHTTPSQGMIVELVFQLP